MLSKLDIATIALPLPQELVQQDNKESLSLTEETATKYIDDILANYHTTVPDLPRHKGKSLDAKQSLAVLLKRMRHQKRSSLLVKAAGAAASSGDAELFGKFLSLEGQSLRMTGDFEITGDNGAQDKLLVCGMYCNTCVYMYVCLCVYG